MANEPTPVDLGVTESGPKAPATPVAVDLGVKETAPKAPATPVAVDLGVKETAPKAPATPVAVDLGVKAPVQAHGPRPAPVHLGNPDFDKMKTPGTPTRAYLGSDHGQQATGKVIPAAQEPKLGQTQPAAHVQAVPVVDHNVKLPPAPGPKL
jgi:hypothetical protein